MNSSSSSSSLLLTLYASVLVPVCSEWISMEDLCFLDTAVCSQELRNMFLEVLPYCSITDEVRENDSSFSWIAQRGLRVRQLHITSRLTPVCEDLIRSKRVSCLIIGLDLLAHHLDCIQTNVPNIAGCWWCKVDVSHLQIVGSFLIEMSIKMDEDESVHWIVACCPNLKRISTSHGSEPFLLPLVDACQLDEINNCHLGSLVKREKCKWTYTCNLKRTSEVNDDDETAVCLGEGKYYHMTSFSCWYKMTEEDSALLIPLMPNLTDVLIDNALSFTVLSAAVEKCRNLRKLEIGIVVDPCKLRQLRHLSVYCNFVKLDECVAAMSEYCPLLEKCYLYQGVVESESVMSELFRKCHFLVAFTASRWPVDSVLPFAVGIDKLELEDMVFANKPRGRQRSHVIPSGVSTGVLCAVLAQNPGLRSVEIYDKVDNIPSVMSSMVQSCPQLTSFDITARWLHNAYSLASLGHLMHLSSLSVWFTAGFTIQTFSAMLENKSSSLLSLTLRDCHISGDMLAVISRLCPALTSLKLDGNSDIENADMIKLLSGCSKLEVLSLRGCYLITSEIVSGIKSPPMKSLDVYGTRITKSVLSVAFDDSKALYYNV